ncbi:hypothetical protein AAFN86_14515 [Roseomonas sp. CAU 1739]|uniref:hypothetical protein n=1 Tax=Roseomonas sp. CAU 1739 TaxID=3140364 RepID=UPI00325BFC44
MDQMDPDLGLFLLGLLGFALLLGCGFATALVWPLTRGVASRARRVALAGIGALGVLQAGLWAFAPAWWRAAPADHLPLLLLSQALVCGALFLAGGPAAAPSSPEA